MNAKSVRVSVPLGCHDEWEPAADRRPIELLEEQADDPSPRAGADPPRAHARLAVHLLPGRRAPDGRRSRVHEDVGHHRAALRRRAPLELRVLRIPGATPVLRRERLRRDRARAVGVGRQAPRGEPRDRRPRQRLHEQGTRRDRAACGALVPRDDACSSRACRCSRSGTRTSISTRCCPSSEASLDPKKTPSVWRAIAKARAHDSLQAFDKLADAGRRRAENRARPPAHRAHRALRRGHRHRRAARRVCRRSSSRTSRRCNPIASYLLEQYRFVHLARKVVGVGSVGTEAWIALFLDHDHGSPLFLQVKQAEASVLERFTAPSAFPNHGQRVVAGQRLMQAASDIFLGWERFAWQGSETRLLLPPAPRLEGLGRHRGHDARGHGPLGTHVRVDARPCARAFGRPHRDRVVPREVRHASTARSPTSPRPTPIRTSATSRRCRTRSSADGSKRRSVCELSRGEGRRRGTRRRRRTRG